MHFDRRHDEFGLPLKMPKYAVMPLIARDAGSVSMSKRSSSKERRRASNGFSGLSLVVAVGGGACSYVDDAVYLHADGACVRRSFGEEKKVLTTDCIYRAVDNSVTQWYICVSLKSTKKKKKRFPSPLLSFCVKYLLEPSSRDDDDEEGREKSWPLKQNQSDDVTVAL